MESMRTNFAKKMAEMHTTSIYQPEMILMIQKMNVRIPTTPI